MNSDAVLRQLNRLMNDKDLMRRHKNIIEMAMNHIKRMGEEFEDITETQHPRDPSEDHPRNP